MNNQKLRAEQLVSLFGKMQERRTDDDYIVDC